MLRQKFFAMVCFTLWAAVITEAAPWMGELTIRDERVWPNGRPGNYGMVHYFVDEAKNEDIPFDVTVQVFADGHPASEVQVEVFSNVNRRDHAKVWEAADEAGQAKSYYMTFPMTHVGRSGSNDVYKTTLSARRTGAYRLTARFRIGHGPWQWHNDFRAGGQLQRDCAIVVSPRKVLNLAMYEANPFVVEASEGGQPNSAVRSRILLIMTTMAMTRAI